MTQEETKSRAPFDDPERVAHMITWRDRYIEKLQERLAGHEEESCILRALLFYALGVASGIADGGEPVSQRELLIPKQIVTELLGAWECRAEDADSYYRVRFLAVTKDEGENRDGTTGAEK